MKCASTYTGIVLALCAASCATPRSSVPLQVEPPDQGAATSSLAAEAEPLRPLPPLTERERELARQLHAYVAELDEIGERNVAHPLELADATDWIVTQASSYGFEVRRQGFSVGDEVVQNLVVHVPGLRRGDHSVVVAARLDSPNGAGGSDDNASGVAALLCLTKAFVNKRALRSIDFVWLADGGGRERADGLGAQVFLDALKKEQRTVTAMVELHGLGAFADAPDSQQPLPGQPLTDSVARFIALSTYPQHANISDHFHAAFADSATLPVARFVELSDGADAAGQSAHLVFLAAGYPAMLVHDTHRYRYADWGGAGDTAERLDYERMARVVAALEPAILALSGPLGEPPREAGEAPDESGGNHPGQ